MTRCLAALLMCALFAFGQRDSSPPAAAGPDPWVVDAVALDSSGRAVTDLTAEDFEIVHRGVPQKITNFTWFDTRLHAAVSRSGAAQLPALGLVPDEIRRNVVAIVDDLGLSPAGIHAVRTALRAFVASSMSPGDRLAVLRSSGGSGVDQQLTSDTRVLVNAIEGIHHLGGSTGAAAAGSAMWETLGYVLEGLRSFSGRKVVVVFSENAGVPGPWDRAASETAHAAHAAGAAVYAIHPLRAAQAAASAAPGTMESLARDSGGTFGGDFAKVLQNEQGYYAIGFQPEGDSIDISGRLSPPSVPAVLKVRRPGVELHYRAGYISRRPPEIDFPVPAEHSVLVTKAMVSPFAAADIRTHLTALLSDYSGQNPTLDVAVHFNPREIAFIRDLQDVYHGTARTRVAAFADDGRLTVPVEREFKITLRPAEYRAGLQYGLRLFFQLKLPFPGAWQIRAVLADGASDRIGSASQFVEIPNVRQGVLGLSGLTLRGGSLAADSLPADPREDAEMRIFKPGRNCAFSYGVFGALIGADKQTVLEAQTRILAEGRVVFEGTARRIVFGETPAGSHRQINGQLTLEPKISPGDYILQVTVRDTLAPPGEPRTATQFIDFQVRE